MEAEQYGNVAEVPEQEGCEARGEPDKAVAVEKQQDVARRVQAHADGQHGGPPAFVLRQQRAQGGCGEGGNEQRLDPGVDGRDAQAERDGFEHGQQDEQDTEVAGGCFHAGKFPTS